MEEIDIMELLGFIKEKIGVLIAITVSVCLLGCIYGLFFQTPMYQSYTTVILGGNENATNGSGITTNDIALNKNLVETYAQIVKSRRVLDQVINKLKLDITYDSLYSKINVTALNNTEIIKITVSDEDAIVAKNIANVTASYFTEEVVDLYNLNNVNILDAAIEEEKPYNINIVKQVMIYIVLGLIGGAGVLFIKFYFDRTIKTVEQVEQKVKLPILGSVQQMDKGGKK